MKYSKKNCFSHRFVSVLLIICFVLSVVPTFSVATASASDADKPALIYIDKDFESQEEGDIPYGFYFTGGIDAKYFRVKKVPTDGNPDNMAANFMGHSEANHYARQIMYYVPAQHDFVVSMDFQATDESKKSITLIHGNTDQKNATYLMGGSVYNFMSITNKIKIDNSDVYTGLHPGKWYSLDLLFKLGTNKIAVRVDGESYGEYSMSQVVKSVDAVRFNCAATEGSDWYIDNYRSYVSDTFLSDNDYANDLAAYEQSSLRPPECYETGSTWRLNPYAFHTLYGEFVMSIGGMRFWKHDKFYTLNSPLEEVDGRIIVPIRVFAESFGADVQWSPSGILVSYNGTTLRFVQDDDTYYVNEKPSKMYHPVKIKDGVSYIQLDVLTNLFGVHYERIDDLISFTGEIVPAYTYSPASDDISATIMKKIKYLLLLRYPDTEQIINAFNNTYPSQSHPRLLFTDWDEVKSNMQRESSYKAAVERIITLADSYMDLPPVSPELTDGLRGAFPQQILDRGRNLSFAYKITGDIKYKNRLWQEVEAIYNNFTDFNPGHQLDPGNSIHGMAYIYDWLYDDWDKETELPKIEAIMERCVYPHINAAYKAATPFLYREGGGYASFITQAGNQPVVINAGMLAASVACFEKDPEFFASTIASVLHGITRSVLQFAPDGAWQEGGSYWTYTVNSLPVLINNLITGLGTDFDICKAPGLMETATFPISLNGPRGSFKIGDDSGTSKTHGYQMFAARQSDDYALAKFYKENVGNYDIISLANFVFDSEIEASGIDFEIQKDYYFHGMQQVTMKSGLSEADTAVILHGGSQKDSHGHRDTGTFLFDMLGERWTSQIGHEDYNLRSYGSYENDGTWNPVEYQTRYYRDRGESKNIVIANYDTGIGDLEEDGKAKIEKYVSTDTGAYAITNLTSNNKVYDCAVRGVMLDRVTGQIIVEDDYLAKENADFWWFMSTDADIEIQSDGKSAILSKNNKRIWVSILNDTDEEFEVLESKPLSEIYPDTYGYAITPPLQTPVNEKIKRLAIHNPSTDHFNVSVVFAPLVDGETIPVTVPQYCHMSKWNFAESATRAFLDSVSVDGLPLAGFKPDKYSYTVNVLTEKSELPKIEATASKEYEIEIKEAQAIPGITTVMLKKDGVVLGIYNFAITPLNDTTTFVSDKQIPVQSFWVTSEPQPENPAIHLFDGNLSTKYATDEFGGSVTIDYGLVHTISEIRMAFTNGAKRTENFMIEYSEDGVNWTVARDKGTNSGTSIERESYSMGDVKARYIRVSFYGNNAGSNWVSVAELCAFTK